MSVTEHYLPTRSGYRLPLTWYAAEAPRASLVLMAALGVAARFYQPLAQALCEAGCHVALVEQRGHGGSALRPSRQQDFGFREAIEEDIPVVLAALQQWAPTLPVVLMGHSLGGHYAAITAGRLPQQVAGVVVCACASPWLGAFRGRIHWQIRLLCALIPLCNRLLGYYPGDRLGFGGREARTLMADWRDLALTNRYRARGSAEDYDQGIAGYSGPLLSIRLADDVFGPEAGMAAVTDKFARAAVSKVVIDASELGDRADHFRWARSPAAIVAAISHWLDTASRTAPA